MKTKSNNMKISQMIKNMKTKLSNVKHGLMTQKKIKSYKHKDKRYKNFV